MVFKNNNSLHPHDPSNIYKCQANMVYRFIPLFVGRFVRVVNPPTPLPGLRGRRKGSTKHRFGVPVTVLDLCIDVFTYWGFCLVFSGGCYVACRGSVCHGFALLLTVSKRLFRQPVRDALTTPCASILLGFPCFACMPHITLWRGIGFRLGLESPELGFRWCFAVSHPLPRGCCFAFVQG